MRLFVSSLLPQPKPLPPPPIAKRTPYTFAINQSLVDTDTFSWWQVNKASDFPTLTGITKDYIFTWSGSHTTVGGGWGQGNNLDLSDFENGGKMFAVGQSQESPRLYSIGGEAFYYEHTNLGGNIQETNLWKLTGGDKTGSLTHIDTQANWVKVPDVLGRDPNTSVEKHTGYLSFEKNESSGLYEGKHMVLPGDTPGGSQYRWSTSPDGITWTREERFYFEYTPDVSGRLFQLITDWNFTIDGVDYIMSYDRRRDIDLTGRGVTNLGVYTDSTKRTAEFLYEVGLESGTDELSTTVFNAQSNYYFDENTNLVHIYHCPNEVDIYHSTSNVAGIRI